MAQPNFPPTVAMTSHVDVGQEVSTGDMYPSEYHYQLPLGPQCEMVSAYPAYTAEAASHSAIEDTGLPDSRVPTHDSFLGWTPYDFDEETANLVPGLDLGLRTPKLFDNKDGSAIMEQYDDRRVVHRNPTNCWPPMPEDEVSLPLGPHYLQPFSKIGDAPDNGNVSLFLKPNVAKRGLGARDVVAIPNNTMRRMIQARPSASTETAGISSVRNSAAEKAQSQDPFGRQAPPLKSSGLYFSSLAEAHQVVHGLNWPPRHDDTLPKTLEERERYVSQLFNAMQDMSDIHDKQSGAMFQKRWLGEVVDQAVENEDRNTNETRPTLHLASDAVYKPWEKEYICWDIVRTAERIYREGTHFVSIVDPLKLQDCEKSRQLPFGDRIAMLGRVFKMYKARVDKLMRGGVVEEYVLCPDTLFKISVSNRHHNDIRGENIVAGRELNGGKAGKKVVGPGDDAVATPSGGRKRARNDSQAPLPVPESETKRSRRVRG